MRVHECFCSACRGAAFRAIGDSGRAHDFMLRLGPLALEAKSLTFEGEAASVPGMLAAIMAKLHYEHG